MATVLRGKRKGQEGVIHQFCNDWFSIDFLDEKGVIIRPTSLQLTAEEIDMVRYADSRGRTGVMLREFDLSDNGRFTRRRILPDPV